MQKCYEKYVSGLGIGRQEGGAIGQENMEEDIDLAEWKASFFPCIILHPHPDTLDNLEDCCTERKNNIVLNLVEMTVLW